MVGCGVYSVTPALRTGRSENLFFAYELSSGQRGDRDYDLSRGFSQIRLTYGNGDG